MRILVFVLLLIFKLPVFSQIGHHTFGGDGYDYFQQILPIDDSTFYLLGTKTSARAEVWLMKVNQRFEVLSEYTYGIPSAHLHGHRMTLLADGSILVAGEQRTDESFSNRTGMLMKLNASGALEWRQFYDDVSAIFDVAEQGDKLLVLGWYDNTGSSNTGVLLGTTQNGTETRRSVLRFSNQTWPKRLVYAGDDEFLVIGRSNPIGAGNNNVFVHRISPQGDSLWTRIFRTGFREREPDDEDFYIPSLGVVTDTDSSVWIVNPGTGVDIFLFHVAFNGDLLASRTHGSIEDNEFPFALAKLPDENLLIAGITSSSGFASKVTRQGRELWREHYQKEGGITRYLDATPGEDGYLLVGMATLNHSLPAGFDGLITKIRADGSILPWQVKGELLFDRDDQCKPSHERIPVSGWPVIVHQSSMLYPPDTVLTFTDGDGRFAFYANEGQSLISILNPETGYLQVCNNHQLVASSFLNPEDSVTFYIQQVDSCDKLQVSIAQPDLIRCDTVCTIISLQNKSYYASGEYTLTIEMDPGLSLISCSEPFMYAGSHVEIEIPAFSGGESKVIDVCFYVKCNAQLGAAHRVNASLISARCFEEYSGAYYSLKGTCNEDLVVFSVKNEGGDGTDIPGYRVFADGLLVADQVPIDLMDAGSSNDIEFVADGRSWRVEISQPSAYPGNSIAYAEVEGCKQGANGLHSIGFSSLRVAPVRDPYSSEFHAPNTSSVPNKIAECIRGAGYYNYIDTLMPIEYSARVVNPFNHIIKDVIFELDPSPTFNIASFQVLTSNAPTQTEYRSDLFHVTVDNANIQPGESAMLRFRLTPNKEVPANQGQSSLMYIYAKAFLDNHPPVTLSVGFNNYSTELLITEDEYNIYSPEVLLYGGKNFDFIGDISEEKDGNLFMIGQSNSYSDRTEYEPWLIKTDKKGMVEWLDTYDVDNGSNSFSDVHALEDGGCMIAGNYLPADADNTSEDRNVHLMQISTTGEVNWDVRFKPAGEAYGALAIGLIATVDHDFIVYGYTSNKSGSDHFYTKFNELGNLLWTTHQEIAGSVFIPIDAWPLPDGSTVFLGDYESTANDYDTYLEKIDREGNVLWSKGHNSENYIYLAGLAAAQDGGFIVAGYSQWQNEKDEYLLTPTIIKFSSEGNFLWEQNIIVGPLDRARVYDITTTPDGNILLAGEILTDSIEYAPDMMVMKINQSGDTIWTKHFGARNVEWVEKMLVMTNGNIALCGHNQPRPPFDNLQGLLVITDPHGNTPSSILSTPNQALTVTTVFPNPASDRIHIILNTESAGIINWQIHSIDGRLITAGSFSPSASMSIDVSKIENGSYFITFPGKPFVPQKLMVIK